MVDPDVLTVRDVARDALLGGSFGYLRIPAGATVRVQHLRKKDWYRVTFDVTAGNTLDPSAAARFNAATLQDLQARS